MTEITATRGPTESNHATEIFNLKKLDKIIIGVYLALTAAFFATGMVGIALNNHTIFTVGIIGTLGAPSTIPIVSTIGRLVLTLTGIEDKQRDKSFREERNTEHLLRTNLNPLYEGPWQDNPLQGLDQDSL